MQQSKLLHSGSGLGVIEMSHRPYIGIVGVPRKKCSYAQPIHLNLGAAVFRSSSTNGFA